VEDVLPGLPRDAFALVFLDPPYADGPDAALAAAGACLAPGGRAVAEHDARRPPPETAGPLRLVDRRAFGGTGVSIYARE
jgi:16S rRNA G966 N2-methylase RsmD